METIKEILMRRDSMTAEDAQDLIDEAKQAVVEGMGPEEACDEFFGLEPDYIWELL